MRFTTMTAGITLLITATLSAAVSVSSEGLAYPLMAPTLSGTWNGHPFEINGTVQEVTAQLEVMYGPNTSPASEALVPRATDNKSQLLCIPVFGQGWNKANYDDVNGCIASMNAFDGVAHVFGGTCGTLARQNRACVIICNDNDHYIQPYYPYLASYAQDLVNQCTSKYKTWYSGGQEFDTDRYNVIVRECDQ